MREELSTLLIGFGQIAAGLANDAVMTQTFKYATHAQVLRDHPSFDLSAVIDPDEGAQANAAENWRIPIVGGSLDDLPDTFSPDVLVLATPPESRFGYINAFPGIKGIVCEKPLGRDVASASRFVEDCRSRQIPLQINLWRRADRQLGNLRRGGLEDRIGHAQCIFGTYGNGLHNNGIHLVDMIRMLCGEITHVRALSDTVAIECSPFKRDVHVPFSLHLQDGGMVTVQPLDFRYYREVGLDIWGQSGRLTIFQEGATMAFHPVQSNRGLAETFEVASDAPAYLESTVGTALYDLYENMCGVLGGRAELLSPGASALQSEFAIHAILASARKGGKKLSVDACWDDGTDN